MTLEEKERLMSLSIEEKVAQSKKVIKEAIEKFGTEKLAIAWTGGKDSTTMTWLFKEACKELKAPMPKCMFIDEGDVFDEIWDVVNLLKKEWNLNERNRAEITNLGFDGKEFPLEPESYVGNHLMKTVAMNDFLENHGIQSLSTAIRWDEQTARKEETYFSPRSNPPHTRIQPILHFKERDIWNAIHKYKIPFCALYKSGYRSLGARCTTFKNSDIPAWEQDMENTTERAGRGQGKEEIMGKLRDLGYM
ncbi:MAG: phosphoadenosine phosphosulfate reductase family protein [Nitrospirae bacterium]|nr:phosphoadenosine phosphosulfate reductase family protein [Nitrospirota bacterium]